MNQKQMTILIDEKLHNDFKVICAKNDISMREVLVRFLEEFTKKHEDDVII